MRMFPDGDRDIAVMFILLSNGSVSIFALTHAIYTPLSQWRNYRPRRPRNVGGGATGL